MHIMRFYGLHPEGRMWPAKLPPELSVVLMIAQNIFIKKKQIGTQKVRTEHARTEHMRTRVTESVILITRRGWEFWDNFKLRIPATRESFLQV